MTIYSDRAEKFVKENTDRYDLIYYGGTKEDSVFYDKKKQREIKTSWKYFKRRIRKDPNICIGFTKDEKAKILKDSIKRKYGVENVSKLNWVKDKKVKTYEEKYGVSHPLKLKKFKEKIKETNIKKYGVDHPLKDPKIKEKLVSTNRKKYGIDYIGQSEEVKEKIKKTNLKKYGTECTLQNEEVKKKTKKTNVRKYGHEHFFGSKKGRKKIKDTVLEKYGKGHYILTDAFLSSSRRTMKAKYGVSHPMKSDDIKKRLAQTRIENGLTSIYKNKTIRGWAEEKGLSYSWLSELVRKQGLPIIDNVFISDSFTYIESLLFSALRQLGIKDSEIIFNKSLKEQNGGYRPDFFISEYKVAIECDGLYWHSEQIIDDKFYHLKKLKTYEKAGFDALFFREDEIRDKLPIVESIILNRIGKSKRLYARKLEHGACSKNFFKQNHLMGKGQGRIYSLNLNGEPQAAMQVKWRSKKEKILEVSRFCTKLNHSVVGGWSKILKRVIEKERPNKVITFIDRRYGSGEYLEKMGWKKINEDLSFKWTDGRKSIHRMKFPGNSGYEKGFVKIWDCGQAKWELKIQ